MTLENGSVILESAALPVMDGEDVTLSCRTKNSSSNIQADFYKDGVHKWTSSTGNLSLKTVLMSDQGYYKCHISGVGESPQSWLHVEVSGFPTIDPEVHKDSNPAPSLPPITPWIIIAVLLMLLLMVVGRHHFGRFAFSRDTQTVPDSRPSEHQTDKDGVSAIYYALGLNGAPQPAVESSIPSASPIDSDVHYSTIQDVAKC
ncbi:uncharacterized protein LOC124995855 [Mugil cephalus]|uniref:uncharacterized protein LOC124995855 n=1 Tax=Mugil cephalus TaxID=48193 RepID=UPI001FB5DEA3|nr:uncharacterized protein LOC124995855 [Mugil cephalus]